MTDASGLPLHEKEVGSFKRPANVNKNWLFGKGKGICLAFPGSYIGCGGKGDVSSGRQLGRLLGQLCCVLLCGSA